MDSLSTGDDFLSSHEDIVGGGPSVVVFVEHGIEGSGLFRISMEDVEVTVILSLDYFSKLLFYSGGQIFVQIPIDVIIFEHLNSLFESDDRDGIADFKDFTGILGSDIL